MTGLEYREQHGDPAAWTDDEYEVFEALATPTEPTNTDPAQFQTAA